MNLRARLRRLEQIGGGRLIELMDAPDVPNFVGLSPNAALRRFDTFRAALGAMRSTKVCCVQPALSADAMAAFVSTRDAINSTHGASR